MKHSPEFADREEIGGLSMADARLYFEGFLSDFEVFPVYYDGSPLREAG